MSIIVLQGTEVTDDTDVLVLLIYLSLAERNGRCLLFYQNENHPTKEDSKFRRYHLNTEEEVGSAGIAPCEVHAVKPWNQRNLRVHYQVIVWIKLEENALDPNSL